MVQTVKIRKGERIIRIHFMYNTDLVEIMQDHKGWFFRKERCWQFPLWKLEPLYDELTSKRYNVEITKLIEQPKKEDKKQKKIDYWMDKDTVAVFGTCTKCGQRGFVGKDNLCVKCK